jgi:hypothetical protein
MMFLIKIIINDDVHSKFYQILILLQKWIVFLECRKAIH